jgi:hypothetical protein
MLFSLLAVVASFRFINVIFLFLLAVVETISSGAGAPELNLFIVADVLFQAVA